MKIKKQEARRMTTTTIIITGIVIFTMLTFAVVTSPKPARAFIPVFCNGCMPQESITANGLGDLICSSGISYPNTQIKFNALVTIKIPGPAKGTVTLTATTASQIQGTITSGLWDPDGTYSLSGTSTSDSACGVPGSPFTISGPTGSSVPISMTGKYDFRGTGDVTATHAKKA